MTGTCFHSINCRSAASCFLKRSILEAWTGVFWRPHRYTVSPNWKGWFHPLKKKLDLQGSLYDTNPNFMHYKVNPSRLPYICCLLDPPQNRSHFMTPVPMCSKKRPRLHLLHSLVLFGGATFQPRTGSTGKRAPYIRCRCRGLTL